MHFSCFRAFASVSKYKLRLLYLLFNKLSIFMISFILRGFISLFKYLRSFRLNCNFLVFTIYQLKSSQLSRANLPRLWRFLESLAIALTDPLPSTWRRTGHRTWPHQEALSIFSLSAKNIRYSNKNINYTHNIAPSQILSICRPDSRMGDWSLVSRLSRPNSCTMWRILRPRVFHFRFLREYFLPLWRKF